MQFPTIAFLLASLAASASFPAVLSAPTNFQALETRGQYSGRGTWFDVGMGNCGKTNQPSDLIVALATETYAGGTHCEKNVVITDNGSGKTATAMVRDSCPSCAAGDLDMSTGLFQQFASLDVGVLDITWDFE